MHITHIDIYIYKLDQHYRLRGVEETPGLLPGTDYFFEPHWRQAYSRKVESCILKLTTDTGLSGWGEAQAPLLPETPASILKNLFGPFLLGKNPLRREWIQDQLYHMNNIRGHGTGMAATWQFAAALPNFLIQEFQLELTQTANNILETPLQAQNGRLIVPQGPGIGVHVNEEALASVTTQHWECTL